MSPLEGHLHGGRPGAPRASKAYWRSLDELALQPEFRRWVEEEFPGGLAQLTGPSRRHFLKLMAASFALAGVVGCERGPQDQLVPYVRAPRGQAAGEAVTFATALTRSGYARGVCVTSYDGRPTKIEGNPKHPASGGGTDVFAQAEILTFYDPERSQAVVGPNGIASWEEFLREMEARLAQHASSSGRGLRLLTGHITGPTQLTAIAHLRDRFPALRWHVHEPSMDARHPGGAREQPDELVYDLSQATRIVAFDCDFLSVLPGSVRYARDFAAARRVDEAAADAGKMCRLYVAEPTPTITGAKADHRLRIHPGDLMDLLSALAHALGVEHPAVGERSRLHAAAEQFAACAARDLRAAPGHSLVMVGRGAPPEVHALAARINNRLDAPGHTLHTLAALCVAGGRPPESFVDLCRDMAGGAVETLLTIDADPVYTAPADLEFRRLLERVAFTAHMGMYRNATAQGCRWHVPRAHELESWDDARAYDGTATILQPLIAPLYAGRTPSELLETLAGAGPVDGQGLVRAQWRGAVESSEFEAWWRAALRDGVVPDTVARALPTASERDGPRAAAAQTAPATTATSRRADEEDALGLVLQLGSRTWDGRWANNAWLQELPDPLTSIVWDNAALLSPDTAARLSLASEDVVLVQSDTGAVELPVHVLPGQADGVVTVALGYGNHELGSVAAEAGANAYALRSSAAPWYAGTVRLHKTGRQQHLAQTQNHNVVEGRDLFRERTAAELKNAAARPTSQRGIELPVVSLYPARVARGQQWGMSIDLTACIGCGACTIACQAENNIAVVGREEVRRGREMHWIRVDRYYAGPSAEPDIRHQPVPCMHCENAPCELVCPTGATQHSHDGLNEMVYNRCIGTRYCSNNCPYKVRRFNFLRYSDYESESRRLQRNPQVSVRARGVMEKCTYCVQRIRAAEIEARKENRLIPDGRIVPACQQACPTHAIEFGDVSDPESRVSRAKALGHAYAMLGELNVRPRTSYLAEIRNPNPAFGTPPPATEGA